MRPRRDINMSNHSFLFWVLLLVNGVFAVDEVSVSLMVKDSVTLHTNVTEIQRNEKVLWNIQGENKFLAIINKEDNEISVPGNNDERFKGRLELDDQTGSLTITDTRTTDSRVYELQISSSNDIKHKRFSVAVHDDVESVSVMEGDSVTLHTGVTEVKGDDKILWKFGDQGTIVADLNSITDARWRDIFYLGDKTGDLTIRNFNTEHTGDYKMEMKNRSMILHKIFRIALSDELKAVAVKVGDFAILRTGLTEILGYDLTWKSEDHLIAEINRAAHRSSLYGSANGISEDRLQLHPQTGSLIISDIKTTDSGDYYLNMSSSSHTIQRNFSVTVRGAASGICGAGVGLVVWAVTAFLLQDL